MKDQIQELENIKIRYQFIQFCIVTLAILGSLFFSEVMKFPPCDLCWVQRVFMYPIFFIILTGFYYQIKETYLFLHSLIGIGWGVSVYHNLIYYKIIPLIVPCSETSPCTAQQLNFLGFITIPLLSLSAFTALGVLQWLVFKSAKGSQK